jgi:hypothetical protein
VAAPLQMALPVGTYSNSLHTLIMPAGRPEQDRQYTIY